MQSANGNRGYIQGKAVRFLNTEHAKVLYDYYQDPPLTKTELKTSSLFLKIIGVGEEGGSAVKR